MMLLNFGQGEAGVGAWPSAKSYPVAEYCTVLSASTPIALDAAPTTEAASCADGTDASRRARTSATQQCFTILVPTFAVEIQPGLPNEEAAQIFPCLPAAGWKIVPIDRVPNQALDPVVQGQGKGAGFRVLVQGSHLLAASKLINEPRLFRYLSSIT